MAAARKPDGAASGSGAEADKPKRKKPPIGRRFQKGVPPNPKGVNGWTKARERVAAALEEHADKLVDKLIEIAEDGDATALKMALGPLLPAIEQKLKMEHEGTVTLRWASDPEPKKES